MFFALGVRGACCLLLSFFFFAAGKAHFYETYLNEASGNRGSSRLTNPNLNPKKACQGTYRVLRTLDESLEY